MVVTGDAQRTKASRIQGKAVGTSHRAGRAQPSGLGLPTPSFNMCSTQDDQVSSKATSERHRPGHRTHEG